jgi:GNAT superfamily N-acetyltransferase
VSQSRSAPEIIEMTDARGAIVQPEWLAKSERVHRQLRPDMPADYRAKMERVFAGGARMAVAVADAEIAGVAVYRHYEDTATGIKFYIDDLVTDEASRSRGIGHALVEYVDRVARDANCGSLVLDSGTQRQQAHKFYFREGFVITSFNFKKRFK